jgi:uncharacterized protein
MTTDQNAGEIAGGYGKAIPLRQGQKFRLVNTFGSQVVDTWALNLHDTSEYLSMEQTRRMTRNLFPEVGDILYSNRRTKMLCLEEDTSPGQHDTMVACCDKWLYKHYGCAPGHRNCRDNFLESLFEAGYDAPTAPSPLNLWMNFPISNNRNIDLATPLSKPGDYVILTALMDCIVICSACPMDIQPVNGEDRIPKAVHYSVI